MHFIKFKQKLYRIYNKYWAYRNPSEFWNKRGSKYDSFDYVTRPFPDDEWLASFITSSNSNKVLEVGCATGRLIKFLSEYWINNKIHNIHIDGLDFSNSMINEARQKLISSGIANVKLFQGQILQLPFADNTYDIVFTRGVLMHLKCEQDVKNAILEMLRVSSKYVIFIEEIAPDGIIKTSGYSPNGLAHWWEYNSLTNNLKDQIRICKVFQNKERLVAYVLSK